MRVESIGVEDRGLQVIDDRGAGDATEVPVGVLAAARNRCGRRRLPSASIQALAKIHLHLFAGAHSMRRYDNSSCRPNLRTTRFTG